MTERKHYEVIGGHTGEVIGCTRGKAGKDEVLAEEPKATFIEVDPRKCRACISRDDDENPGGGGIPAIWGVRPPKGYVPEKTITIPWDGSGSKFQCPCGRSYHVVDATPKKKKR